MKKALARRSLILGALSIVLFLVVVNLPTIEFVSGSCLILSMLLAVAGVILGGRDFKKIKDKATALGLLISILAVAITFGIIIFGHYLLYGPVGI